MTEPELLFEDENYLVFNKPSGVIVNKADTSKGEITLQEYVESHFKLEKEIGTEFSNRGGIVHRLDKQTSGVIIVAKNSESFSFLQKQFKERTVKKEYTALCHGKTIDEGTINVPIGRLPWNRMRFGVIPNGREALTKFRTISHHFLLSDKNKLELSLVRVFPKTGRTHQIRVHFQYAGHPIFADSLYAGRKTYQNDKKYLSRHFLHASKITFADPGTKEEVSYEAPLSLELDTLLKKLC